MLKPEGIIVPIITPMTEDEEINEKELRAQINRMISSGIHGIFCLGTNGEFYALTTEEKLKVIKVVVEETRGRVPVYAGTGCISTKETVDLSIKAKELGVDALSILSPYYVAVSQDDIYDYFAAIAQSVDLPIVLYNIPARTGNNIDYKTVARLSKYQNIVGIKDSSGNFDNTLRYIEDTDDRLSVLSGNDSLILWTLLAGGNGAIAGTANLFPELLVEIYRLWQKGEIKKANELQKKLRPFRDVMKMGNPNSVVKRAMNLLGYNVGPARRPVSGLNPKIDEELEKVLKLYK
ncbi:4-hydroxy-tetrahydrodipicolinate synthase [Biomaibacter acetigenes]|jgi:4-hydroxy-tetrahydrodipicolinate synthase|uniref:4-hydroxy-tetrahydrodipicolinate synthase n=1 Tax=Biomaibacter acetigenes TaxID=2316383 RepID=A0A3G2R6K5_9FIRM|nr:4-hydroxy-tetrahydrodipicolinate synthase [Biomaibacter acetigenes]AYO31082.1 4-hydroxy-tetrahydrodipicolinate synthase [Biomaibacter acetigenes]RKL63835.1 4-hydroxy-tetrahydrodipicolinate synthase [Thermoanaerobacteraceae bacterium SP2]